MCEDHKPSNKRERFRVEKRLKIGQQVLPVPLKAFDQSDEDFVQLYCHRFFGQSPLPAKSMGKSFEDSTSFKFVWSYSSRTIMAITVMLTLAGVDLRRSSKRNRPRKPPIKLALGTDTCHVCSTVSICTIPSARLVRSAVAMISSKEFLPLMLSLFYDR
jgi:hypothetical protein